MTQQTRTAGEKALNELIHRDEVLEICFWYQGEGFGEVFTANALETFLNVPTDAIERALDQLVGDGLMRRDAGAYRLSEEGRKKGGRSFAESFAEFQTGGHGECDAGCCDGDEHDHDHHHHAH